MQALSLFIRVLHLVSSAVHGVGVVLDSTDWVELSKGIRVGVVLDSTAWAELRNGIRVGKDCVDESKMVDVSSKL